MRVWRFKYIGKDENNKIDENQSFSALSIDESQTATQTKKDKQSTEETESKESESLNSESQIDKKAKNNNTSKTVSSDDQESNDLESSDQASVQTTSDESETKYFDEPYKRLMDTCDRLQEELQQIADSSVEEETEKNEDISDVSREEKSKENLDEFSNGNLESEKNEEEFDNNKSNLEEEQKNNNDDDKLNNDSTPINNNLEKEQSENTKLQEGQLTQQETINKDAALKTKEIFENNRNESKKNNNFEDEVLNNQSNKSNELKSEEDKELNESSKESISNETESNSENESKENGSKDNIEENNVDDSSKEKEISNDLNDEKNKAKKDGLESESKENKSEGLTKKEKDDLNDILNSKSNLSKEEQRKLLNKAKKKVNSSKRYKATLTPQNIKYIKNLEEQRKSENNSNNISDALDELPSFENRDHGDGYAINPQKLEEVPNSVIKTLIDKFLNQRFCKKETNLNIRSNSLEETDGFHKWKVKDVIVHLKSHQVTKVLTDKVGYTYADGKNENVPLSFYFDMSGSMEAYSSLLATIAIELLKKDVKVLIGYNEHVNVQIEKIDKDISIDELIEFLTEAGDYDYNCIYSLQKQNKITYIDVNKNIDSYLVDKKGEKCVVFSDFDPLYEVVNLSVKANVYWFCFEDSFDRYDLKQFKGFIYKVNNINDIAQGLIKVNSKRFESLCFTDNPEELKGKARVRYD